jgi:N-methylhydantoinase A/oxoprolinase/acetone carboxylase beta subunit
LKLVIGIDTGGTYTDAVLLDKNSGQVVMKAKALTTPHDLSLGIAQAIERLGNVDYNQVRMVSISTTLATNAIVEGQGGRVGLFLIGYDQEIMEQQGLAQRLPVQAMVYLAGGHDVKGEEICPLDYKTASKVIQETKDQVDAYAVSGFFSVMNPDHEVQLRTLIQKQTTAPVVCGHELTNKLNALKRVSTVVLNARLLPLISHLLDSVSRVLFEKGCQAPLMVVKGDGTLISEGIARQRPVETILSGPAASVIGAEFLADVSDAIVVDMGGTTTDIAILEKGLPWSNPAGAIVGGWQTCVQAADLRTIGIGGDSHIHLVKDGSLHIGPRRAIPLSRLGSQFPEIVQQLTGASPYDWESEQIQSTDYIVLTHSHNGVSLTPKEAELIEILHQRPVPLFELRRVMGEHLSRVEQLEIMGVVRKAGLTPTDVLWSESIQEGDNLEAAQVGTEWTARQLNMTVESFTEFVREQVVARVAEEVLDKLFSDITNHSLSSAPQAWKKMLECLLGYDTFPDLCGYIQVRKPIIAIGAPVRCFIPKVAERLHSRCIIPSHAEVGNAVGAAVASITHTVEILVQPHIIGSGTLKYLVHSPHDREVFSNLEEAVERAERIATETATQNVHLSGGESCFVTLDRKYVTLGVLSEVTVRACATNRVIKEIRAKRLAESNEK